MTKDDEACLKLGREVSRMIRDVVATPGGDTAYGRRRITFPGGEVHLLIAKDSTLADVMEAAADKMYDVETITPRSQTN